MPQCSGIKRDGGRCTVVVGPGQTHCYQHDPRRTEDRRRNASKGGRTKGNQRLAKLDRQLDNLAAGALEGKIERGVAAVVNQVINARVRLLEVERKIKEVEELEARLEALSLWQGFAAFCEECVGVPAEVRSALEQVRGGASRDTFVYDPEVLINERRLEPRGLVTVRDPETGEWHIPDPYEYDGPEDLSE